MLWEGLSMEVCVLYAQGPGPSALHLGTVRPFGAFTDSAATLANYWHYDRSTAVAAGKNDMYSVALHELMHVIGFGSSFTWDSKRIGSNWTGTNVIALTGSGINALTVDGAHILDSTMSTRILDGTAQEAVMDPSITAGTRKTLTQLDLAYLRDLGYATVVPEPSVSVLLLIAIGMSSAGRRRRRRA